MTCNKVAHLGVILLLACSSCAYLLENCGWQGMYDVTVIPKNLSAPSERLSANLICQTFFIIKKPSSLDLFRIKIKTHNFDLQGPDSCIPYSERLIFQFTQKNDFPDLVWCGKSYADEMFSPAVQYSISAEVKVIYKVGSYGQGTGFTVEFSNAKDALWNSRKKLEVLPTPKLFYFPFIRSNSNSLYLPRNLPIKLYAAPNLYMHISIDSLKPRQSPEICGTSLLVNNVWSICGEKSENFFWKDSSLGIDFSPANQDERYFVIEYISVSRNDELFCTKDEIFIIEANDQEKLIEVKLDESSLNNINCLLRIQAQSEDKVLQMQLPTWQNFEIIENGLTVNISSLRYFRSKSGNATIAIRPLDRSAMNVRAFSWNLTVQAVDKEWLPTIQVYSNYLIWVTSEVINKQKALQFVSETSIGFKVFTSTFNPEPVSKYLGLFNGPDVDYFELTKDCNGGLLSNTEITSINSSVVIASFRQSSLPEFPILVYPIDPEDVLVPTTPATSSATSGSYTFRANTTNSKNLFCRWELKPNRGLPAVKFQAQNNFDFASSNTMLIKEGSLNTTIASIDKSTPGGDSWLISHNPLLVVDVAVSGGSPQFSFAYKYTNISVQDSSFCSDQLLGASSFYQSASTPNYPNFYPRYIHCKWKILNTSGQFGSKIAIIFTKLYSSLCQNWSLFTVTAANSQDRVCNLDSFSKSYFDNVVSVEFSTLSGLTKPGFQFQYMREDPQKVMCGDSQVMSEDTYYQLEFSGSSTMIEDCIFMLFTRSYSVITLIVNQDFLYSNAMTVYTQQGNTWTPVLQLSSKNNRKGNYTFTKSTLRIKVNWEYMYTPFLIYSTLSQACSSDQSCITEWIEPTTPRTFTGEDSYNPAVPIFIGTLVACVIVAAVIIAAIIYCVKRRKFNRPRLNREGTVTYDRRTSAVFIFNPVIINNAPPPPYPGLDYAEIPQSLYSGSSRFDEATGLELPPPYSTAAQESNLNAPGPENLQQTGTTGENIYESIGHSDASDRRVNATGSEASPEPPVGPAPPAYSPGQDLGAPAYQLSAPPPFLEVLRPHRQHRRGNHSLGDL